MERSVFNRPVHGTMETYSSLCTLCLILCANCLIFSQYQDLLQAFEKSEMLEFLSSGQDIIIIIKSKRGWLHFTESIYRFANNTSSGNTVTNVWNDGVMVVLWVLWDLHAPITCTIIILVPLTCHKIKDCVSIR